MTTLTGTRRPARRYWVGVAAMVTVTVALVYLIWSGYLAVMASEGSLPPGWRDPDVPAGARVVSESKECASGGCWRQLALRPAPGQTPDELAAAMGLVEEQRFGWHPLDPHPVVVGSHVRDGELDVYVQY